MKIYSLLVFATFCVIAILAKSRLTWLVQRVSCTVHDETSVSLEMCMSKAVNRTTTFIHVAGNFTKEVKTLLVHSQLFKKSEIKYRPFLVNVTDNFCDFFSKKVGGAYLRIVWPLIMPFTNINHQCPYYGYHFIKNLPIDDDKLPEVWPVGIYLLKITFLDGPNNKLLTADVYFEVKEQRAG
ncbi:uncharacterized protein LOC129952556 isoform X1 [Eupeodes corollae]|uniref:uncharacterized protein LOC129952556 isoform X1 n=1 Tax=Eupeodes corollae TaxID=290404 RepID=UPI002491BDA9|nr:uncharacterized protein LOC129952556 isoform X1 [Eupeodes corollae]